MEQNNRHRRILDVEKLPQSQELPQQLPQTPTSLNRTQPRRSLFQKLSFHRQKVLVVAIIGALIIGVGVWAIIGSRQNTADQPQNPVAAEYQKQLPELEASVRKNPDDGAARKNLAVALYATGDVKKASQQYEKSVELNDQDAVAYNNLGNTYRDLGDTNKAVDAYQKSLKLDPKSMNTYANLANLQLYSLNQPDVAIDTYQRGLEQLPDNTDLQLLLAGAYAHQGDKDSARDTYQAIITRDPDNAGAQAGLERVNK